MLVIDGGGKYRKPPGSTVSCPSGLVTVTLAGPATWAGVVAVMEVVLATVT